MRYIDKTNRYCWIKTKESVKTKTKASAGTNNKEHINENRPVKNIRNGGTSLVIADELHAR